jgi:hypothetical protein
MNRVMAFLPRFLAVRIFSRNARNIRIYLLRVMVNEIAFPPVVVTVYRTGRIEKYWEAGT